MYRCYSICSATYMYIKLPPVRRQYTRHSEDMLLNFFLVALTTVNAYKFMPDSMGAAPTDYVSLL